MESSISELIDMVKSPLSEAELKKMVTEVNLSQQAQQQEPDAYSVLLNAYTQKNTDALVKCKYVIFTGKYLQPHWNDIAY